MPTNNIKQMWEKSTPKVKILSGVLAAILVFFIGNRLLIQSSINKNIKLQKQTQNADSYLRKKDDIIAKLKLNNKQLEDELKNINKGADSKLFSEASFRKGNHMNTIASIDSLLEGIGLLIVKRHEDISNSAANSEGLMDTNIGVVTYNYSLEGSFRKIFYFFGTVNRISSPFKIVNISTTKDVSPQNLNPSNLTLTFDVEVPYLKNGRF